MVENRQDRLLGRFWLAANPDEKLTGWLDLSGSRPRITLHGQLTPHVTWQQADDGSMIGVPAEDEHDTEGHLIHGYLAEGFDRAVTIFNAITVSRRQNIMTMGTMGKNDEEGVHSLQGTWAARGAHLDNEEQIQSARIRFTNLDDFICQNGTKMTITLKPSESVNIEYQKPARETAPLATIGGHVSTRFVRLYNRPDTTGAEVRHAGWLDFDDINQQNLFALLDDIVAPTLILASIMLDVQCKLTHVQALTSKSETYVRIYHPLIEYAAESKVIEPGNRYMDLRHTGLQVVAKWIECASELAPVPNILYSALEWPQDLSLESRLLQLSTSAEGYDRRRYRDAPIFDPELAKAARKAAKDAAIAATNEEIGEKLHQSLAHFNQVSYPFRLRRLLSSVEDAIPDAFGNQKKWVSKIANARNSFAHLLNGPGNGWEVDLILTESLKWILGTAFLLQAGVESETIKARLKEHQPYQFFQRKARNLAPEIYMQTEDSKD
ncbi:hypothetical protein GCM10027598_10630 [Amycolatopsis oliviviridis]|uniref:ApeA N-terminal domain-containing protein n=1 Tax=Amycolatopsis oliviviridis TaxID=1471590 RepID=A0ABQ3M544_9PSEU|nr:HEPN domain-containing protein [Amycolatopsis oliviviridis]GHH27047.1 hypothetical protein GCM10017790_55510 [Amycolatopsis oliviviridis]